jgi:hypothetical protein
MNKGLLLQGYSSRFRLGSEFKPADMASDGGTCGEFGTVETGADLRAAMEPGVTVFHASPFALAMAERAWSILADGVNGVPFRW